MIFERIAPEQHDTLDGVPEPSETPRLVGHGQAATMLASAYRSGKLPHALIFVGPVGIGKATLAFHLAHHLLKHPASEQAPEVLAVPDPASSLFRQIATGAHPSVLHLTRPPNDKTKSFKTVVTVDEIRKVSRFLSLTSHDGSYRVVIVDPADDMNTNAANALLKNLEEPPARTLFILIVHAPGSLLPTIRSRCQMVRLTPLDAESLMRVLESDVAGAYRLAEAVAGRDQAIQFDIFNRRALDLLSTGASQAALAGDLARAKTLSDTWHEALNAISETDTYNLDKKQHALTMIDRLNSAMRM
ncbi:MAG: DNA polymerase III subunit delta' [Mesorhizobium sp.]|nr:MAG: DNA polymerase III subunit delta' [Mesorhizobium sp.]